MDPQREKKTTNKNEPYNSIQIYSSVLNCNQVTLVDDTWRKRKEVPNVPCPGFWPADHEHHKMTAVLNHLFCGGLLVSSRK